MIVYSLVLTLLLFGNIDCTGYYAVGHNHNDKFVLSNEYPTVVALYRLSNDSRILPYCGGNIIHRSRVLTTAQCVVNPDVKIDLTGMFVLSEAADLRFSKVHKVKSAIIHPKYELNEQINDIAIVEIEGSFSEYITPMIMVRDDTYDEKKLKDCKIVGWRGLPIARDNCISYLFNLNKKGEINKVMNSKFDCEDKCLQTTIPIDTNMTLCKEQYELMYPEEGEVCVFRSGTSEMLDLGVPVICSGVQYAVVFRNLPTGETGQVSKGLRLSYYMKWIEESFIRLDFRIKVSEKKIPEPDKDPRIDETSPVVSIYKKTVTNEWYPYCGGTIIHSHTVLTAASCLINIYEQPELDGIFVLSGSTDLRFSNIHAVVHMSSHPEYDRVTRINDIGLILVGRPFGPQIVPVKLAVDWYVKQIMNSPCKIFGWGFQGTENLFSTNLTKRDDMKYLYCRSRCKLHSALVRTIPARNCIMKLDKMSSLKIEKDKGQFCTYRGLYDKCHGQSGDPIICSGTQYGIVSWGYGCDLSIDHPVVITGVGYYIDWILEETINLERHIPS